MLLLLIIVILFLENSRDIIVEEDLITVREGEL
jgi:hypothetical protein